MADKTEGNSSHECGEEAPNSGDQVGEPTAESERVGEGVESLRGELEKSMEEVKSVNDKYFRVAAEFENYKRRAQRDQSDAIRFANEKLLKDLLPTIDNLERAIHYGGDQTTNEGLVEGIELTYKQLLETLAKFGVRQISSKGELFDPAQHQAVAQVDSETAKPNSVVDEFQKGYFLHERILRPAMVTVAKDKPAEGTSSLEDQAGHEEGAEE